jgi:NAD(P)-dependent dehydrogenase (short-subunit alcohol dehydrogenase family)
VTAEQKTALVTGANSGIGLATVKELSRRSFSNIVLVCRTVKKAKDTREQLLRAGFNAHYRTVGVDLAEAGSSFRALDALINDRQQLDLLVLNATVFPATSEQNSIGMEMTAASALLGHHILATGLLDRELLSDDCRIVTAGSEAARGDVPGMALPKLEKLISKEFKGDTDQAFRSFMFPKSSRKHHPMKAYAMTKLMVSLWTSAMARKMPEGMIANSISPGATPRTNFARHQSWLMRKVMMPMMDIMGPMMGMAGSVEDAAKKYLRILELDSSTNGKFWASKKGKMAGPLAVFSSPYIDNETYQESIWNLLAEISKRG